METTNKNNKKIIVGIIALIAVIALFFGLYTKFSPKAETGSKDVTIEVIDDKGSSTMYEVSTDAEYLRQAMEEAEGLEFSGEETEYGLTLMEVNGVVADFNVDGAYWSIMVNGEYGQYGADAQVVSDGDAFQLVYTVYE
ncbi:DUF4430 domain-containing protein [Frisingicoccus sp.]|uniref:DUF4430 domain-containing protein n=1 Tax=Frisingicoccus sp. TaxID=1918627 RepID=UPI00386DC80E